jgi:hypothetical protein
MNKFVALRISLLMHLFEYLTVQWFDSKFEFGSIMSRDISKAMKLDFIDDYAIEVLKRKEIIENGRLQ